MIEILARVAIIVPWLISQIGLKLNKLFRRVYFSPILEKLEAPNVEYLGDVLNGYFVTLQ